MSRVIPWTGTARVAIAALALLAAVITRAGDGIDAQDEEMLEFLGSWEAEDEDWLVVSMEELMLDEDAPEAGDEAHAEAAEDER